jgi:hypothetical protein
MPPRNFFNRTRPNVPHQIRMQPRNTIAKPVIRETVQTKEVKRSGSVVISGMYGIGDNIHQRAVLRELMKTNEVWLETCHVALYHDLIEQGLKLKFKGTSLHAQARTIRNEQAKYPGAYTNEEPPLGTPRHRLWYNKPDIDKFGSITEAMFGVLGIDRPDYIDFTLPIPDDWKERAEKISARWNRGGKPLMLFRPTVLRKEWDSASRNPDIDIYNNLYKEIRSKFFVVSVADLLPGIEWIVGNEMDADIKLHKGELDFETMAALFKQANMVFSAAGFSPVLAQAVGTRNVIVYGGRESFRTTERAGAHLAPTLGIDPINPCDCHWHKHDCDKRIDYGVARAKLWGFIDGMITNPRVLIFGTTYVDCLDRMVLTKHWINLHKALNPSCDLMLVDSASPLGLPYSENYEAVIFEDNIGHLSRKGRDGWGRAFSWGLQEGVERGYDFIVHIEGDSLFKLPVIPIVNQMIASGTQVASVPVKGMRRDWDDWVETGLMFFRADYLKKSKFVEKYNWQERKEFPTPEVVVKRIIGTELTMMPWKALRGDKNQITHENIISLGLDWVTHCHNDVWAYDRFMEDAMLTTAKQIKLNVGCGRNRLSGWRNVDSEIDITKPLPLTNGSVTHILAEHVVEHVTYFQAIDFFRECKRVLGDGGVLRVCVPSVEQIMKRADKEYCEFTTKWQPDSTVRGAMYNILYKHGHACPWTESLMETTLFFVGFSKITKCEPRVSEQAELNDVDGHHKEIGDRANWIETIVYEATK